MTDPSRTLTFGVEYELVIGSLAIGTPDPEASDGRTIYFPSLPDYDNILIEQQGSIAGQEEDVAYNFTEHGFVAEVVAKVLRENGVSAYPWFRHRGGRYKEENRDLRWWEVKIDGSVWEGDGSENPWWPLEKGRGTDPYEWHGLEIVSPVMKKGFSRGGRGG